MAKARSPTRRTRARAGATAFDLSRAHRLAPIAIATPAELSAVAGSGPVALELAWDGERVLVCRTGADVRIVAAPLRDRTDAFAPVAALVRRLAATDFVVEGWICALDGAGRPSFDALRAHVAGDTKRLSFVAWDVQRIGGEDLRALRLAERRRRLRELVAGAGRVDDIIPSEPLPGRPADVVAAARAQGLRGVVARPDDAPYPTGPSWLAIPCGDAPLALDRDLSPPPRLSNADKVLYPRDGLTKRDVFAYYADAADVLLPLMRDRPVVGQRWPDGIDEFTWYQHRVPPRAPDYLRGAWIDGDRRIVVEGRDALLWLVNQAVLTFHGWASRLGSLDQPDWVVVDLDPGEATRWDQTIEVALALRKLLDLLELPSVPKTSGQKGLHVLVPIAAGHRVDEAHELARRVAGMLERLMPDVVTTEISKERRNGRLYLDHAQGFVGKSLVLPYSLRAADGAPISTPLEWAEITPALDPRSFTLRTLRRRLDDKGDLARALLGGTAKLGPALAKLAR